MTINQYTRFKFQSQNQTRILQFPESTSYVGYVKESL